MSSAAWGVIVLVAFVFACLCVVDGLISYLRTLRLRILVQKERERYRALFPNDDRGTK